MFKVIFTLDYEIHGNGDGNPFDLMVEPTWRIINILEKYNAKLTVFADAAQINKYKEYYQITGEDKFHYRDIVSQLEFCVKHGHDVQLHLHSSFISSNFNGKKWVQSWKEYDLASLDYQKIFQYIKIGKQTLCDIISKVDSDYQCNVFRAANWCMQPSYNITRALVKNDFKIDSSVYKWGKQSSLVNYDYSNAHHNIFPYLTCNHDINVSCKGSKLIEIPIYCEKRSIFSFISYIRVYRVIRALFHKHISPETLDKGTNPRSKTWRIKPLSIFKMMFSYHPRKLDFNQLTSSQQIRTLKRIKRKYKNQSIDVPIVFIGHSKTFLKKNSKVLEKTLNYLLTQEEFSFSLYKDINLEPDKTNYDF